MKCKFCDEDIIFTTNKLGRIISINTKSLSDKDKEWLINRDGEMKNVLLPFRYGEHQTHSCKRKPRHEAVKKQERPIEDINTNDIG